MLLLSGLSVPGLPILEDDGSDGSTQGQVVFTSADYLGPAQVHADEGALWSEGALEATIHAEAVTVERYEWTGAKADAEVSEPLYVSAHHWSGDSTSSSTTYENATIRIDTTSEGLLSILPNATRGPTAFSVSLDQDEVPSILASPLGPRLWLRYPGPYHHVGGPLFALSHNGGYHVETISEETRFQAFGVSGALDLNVIGGTVTVQSPSGHDTYQSGVEKIEHGAGPASVSTTTKRVHTLIYATNATVTTALDRTESVFFAKEPTWRLNGTLRFEASEGKFQAGTQNVSLTDDTVTLVGNTTLSLEALGEEPSPTGPRHAPDTQPPIRAGVESDSRSMNVNGQQVAGTDGPVVPEEVSLLGQILGALLLVFSLVNKLPAFLVGLLARNPLSNDRRQRIYDFIQQAGMAHPRLVSRALGIPVSSAVYHLHVLLEADMLTLVEAEGYKVYFACTRFSLEEKERLATLAGPTRKQIADLVVETGGCTQDELLELLDVTRGTVSKHLNQLREAGLVEGEGGNGIEYRPSRLLEDWFVSTSAGSV